jgi:hypothetical protein
MQDINRKPEGKKPLGDLGIERIIVKVGLREIGFKSVD